jgi:DNA-binding CsgD family transcriptional regulator
MRAIAASGLAPQLAAPEIVKVLVDVLGIDCRPIAAMLKPGSANRAHVWLEDGGVLHDVARMRIERQSYHPPEIPVLDDVVAGAAPLGTFGATLWGRGARSSGPWEDLWRGHHARHGAQAVFRSRGGRMGMLLLARSGRADAFKARDFEAIERGTHYLAQLADHVPDDVAGDELIETASVVLDQGGAAVLMSDNAQSLLARMGGPGELISTFHGAMAYLISLAAVGRSSLRAQSIVNGYGAFRTSLNPMAGPASPARMMLVRIDRFVPVALLVARGAVGLKASGRQIDLAVRLARQETLAAAAAALNISHATCRYYLAELFNRTDTNSQSAMLARLAELGRAGLVAA